VIILIKDSLWIVGNQLQWRGSKTCLNTLKRFGRPAFGGGSPFGLGYSPRCWTATMPGGGVGRQCALAHHSSPTWRVEKPSFDNHRPWLQPTRCARSMDVPLVNGTALLLAVVRGCAQRMIESCYYRYPAAPRRGECRGQQGWPRSGESLLPRKGLILFITF
jgi:hypothetical protein